MSIKDKPHFRISAQSLADWLDTQPERWWVADGDPLLMSSVAMPCPSDEISPLIRRIGKDLLVYDKSPGSKSHGELLGGDRIESLTDCIGRHRYKALLLSWIDSDIEWMLVEDEALVSN